VRRSNETTELGEKKDWKQNELQSRVETMTASGRNAMTKNCGMVEHGKNEERRRKNVHIAGGVFAFR